MRLGTRAVIITMTMFTTACTLQCSQSGAFLDQMANLLAKGAKRLLCAPLCSMTAHTAIGAASICKCGTKFYPMAFLVAKATHHLGSAERHLVVVDEN